MHNKKHFLLREREYLHLNRVIMGNSSGRTFSNMVYIENNAINKITKVSAHVISETVLYNQKMLKKLNA